MSDFAPRHDPKTCLACGGTGRRVLDLAKLDVKPSKRRLCTICQTPLRPADQTVKVGKYDAHLYCANNPQGAA